MMNPKVNILILNWNGEDTLANCIDSVFESDYDNYRITIIDNNSNDNIIDNLNYGQKINIIKIDRNLGYARGYNYGFDKIKNLDDDYYFILNNDTLIEKNSISKLIQAMEKYGSNNIYGPKIINQKNNKNWFCGGKINIFTGHPYHLGIDSCDSLIYYKSSEVDFISGCCMLISKNLLNNLKGFNESYKMYYEDVDLCRRAVKNNAKCFFISESSITHLISYSIGGRYSARKYIIKIKSFIRFIYLNNHRLLFLIYFIINLILSPVFVLYYFLKRS